MADLSAARALLVRPAPSSGAEGVPPIVVRAGPARPDPGAGPTAVADPALSPVPAGSPGPGAPAPMPGSPSIEVDGVPVPARLEARGSDRARLAIGDEPPTTARIVFVAPAVAGPDGVTRQEIVVDGWRMEIEFEPEHRAALRERARRAGEASGHGGPTEVRSVFPGRVVSVAIAAGDEVAIGQPLLVIEAMKMQNELRSPRAGRVARVDVGAGTKVEVGDLLLAIE